MKRAFDLTICCVAALVLIVPLVLVAVAVRVTSAGPVLYWSERVGRDNRPFMMPKFRSMRVGTPALASHLLDHPERWLTSIGPFLRKTSLDELPQLWSIFRGDMSFVGPRPALFNQYDLIALRQKHGLHVLKPGLTGWAQVNGLRGQTSIEKRIEYDLYYIENWSLMLDLKILVRTALGGFLSRNAY